MKIRLIWLPLLLLLLEFSKRGKENPLPSNDFNEQLGGCFFFQVFMSVMKDDG